MSATPKFENADQAAEEMLGIFQLAKLLAATDQPGMTPVDLSPMLHVEFQDGGSQVFVISGDDFLALAEQYLTETARTRRIRFAGLLVDTYMLEVSAATEAEAYTQLAELYEQSDPSSLQDALTVTVIDFARHAVAFRAATYELKGDDQDLHFGSVEDPGDPDGEIVTVLRRAALESTPRATCPKCERTFRGHAAMCDDCLGSDER